MRIRDDEKVAALFEATVKLVNEIGFASSSVAKIAKEANVSPATMYVYYRNKDDLLVSTYLKIKQRMSEAFLKDFDDTLPIKDIFKRVWVNVVDFIVRNRQYYAYTEQFYNSPYIDLVDSEEVEKYFEPFFNVLHRGIEEGIIKDVDCHILQAFMFHPITVLATAQANQQFELSAESIDTAFMLAWDAIKR